MGKSPIALATGMVLLALAVYASSALLHFTAVVVLMGGGVWMGMDLARQTGAWAHLAKLLMPNLRFFALVLAVALMAPALFALVYVLYSAVFGASVVVGTSGATGFAAIIVLLAAATCALIVAVTVVLRKPPRTPAEGAA